jgi:type IV pilus assembly protein PilQ
MTYETAIDGNAACSFIDAECKDGGAAPRVEHFSQANPSQDRNSIRDISFRRGKDGEARITVDLADS